MGMAKNEMMRLEDLRSLAELPLQKAGAIKPCDLHDDVLIDQDDPEAVSRAYAIGTNMVKAGEVDGTREEFMDAIQSALENAFDECPSCSRAFGRD